MAFLNGIHGRLTACALAALSVSACATGQGSFVAGSGGGGGSEEAFFDDAPLDEAAPGLLAASGNALLPGVRTTSPAAVTAASGPNLLSSAPALLSTGSITANVDAKVNLLGAAPSANLNAGLATSLASANVSTNLGGPLLALNGSNAPLLGVGVTGPTVLGVTPNLSANLGVAINPATAATQTLISASVGATQPQAGPSPLLPPVIGVPGTTPLQTLLPLLTAPTTSPKPPVLPGLLGQ